jgi:hypothetical protein
MTWHIGPGADNGSDRLLFGIPSKFNSFEDAISFFKGQT